MGFEDDYEYVKENIWKTSKVRVKKLYNLLDKEDVPECEKKDYKKQIQSYKKMLKRTLEGEIRRP